jgi:surface antigen
VADDVTFTVAADATPPGGTKAATDEITAGPHTGAHAGIAKLAVSADGDGTHIPATVADGLLVDVSNASIPVTGGLTDAELRASPVDVDGSGVTQPVSNAGLTALNGAIAGTEVQTDIVGALPAGNNNIGDVDIASLPNEGQQTMANSISVAIASNQSSVPVTAAAQPGVDIGDVTVNNAAGAAAVNIQDGGNTITVDGTVGVSGTVAVQQNRAATSALTTVADNAASVTILASNANRLKALITNDSSARLYLRFEAAAASTSNYGVSLAQYETWEEWTYTGEIRGIWATDPGDGAARVTEFTA